MRCFPGCQTGSPGGTTESHWHNPESWILPLGWERVEWRGFGKPEPRTLGKRALSAGVSPSVSVSAWSGRSPSRHWQNCQPAVLEATPSSFSADWRRGVLPEEASPRNPRFSLTWSYHFPYPGRDGHYLEAGFCLCNLPSHFWGQDSGKLSLYLRVCVCHREAW